MTGVDELIAFVRTCLDDDEATAAIISSGGYMAQTWHAGPDGPGHVGVLLFAEDRVIGDPPEAVERYDEPFAIVIGGRAEHRHIARWDPSRVLAEVEANRRILDLHVGAHDCPEMVTGTYPADWPPDAPYGKAGQPWAHPSVEHFEDGQPCSTVRLLAQPYAGRPGWREEWRLDAA